jgi:ribosome-binding factor A
MRKKPSRRDLRALCAEVHADDGVDPREFLSRRGCRGGVHPRIHRKDLQLAKQVSHAIGLALQGDLSDPVLQDLQVVSVRPAPDALHLTVVLEMTSFSEKADLATVLSHLEGARGMIRGLVTSAITRKRAPELSYQVIQRGEVPS